MPTTHILIALFVVAVWSFNFIAIKVGLDELPPIFMAGVRFTLTAIPAIFFIRPPAAPWQRVAWYGILAFALQFGLLFAGMAVGLPPSVAAVSLQLSVFVTIALAWVVQGERVSPVQLLGASVAMAGLLLIGINTGGDVTIAGLLLGLLAACFWGAANIVGKSIGKVNMLALITWSSVAAPVPLFALSLAIEGPARIGQSFANLTWLGVGAVAFIVYVSTHLGYSAWAWLMARHPAGTVAPFTLLVPITAAALSSWLLGEAFPAWKVTAGALVIGGVLLNLFGGRILAAVHKPRSA